MLDPAPPIRKDSFRAGSQKESDPRCRAKALEVREAGAGQEGERERQGQRRISQQGASNRRSEAPSGVAGDDLEKCRIRGGTRRSLPDVGLRGEPIVEQSRQDGRLGIEFQDRQGAAPDGSRQIDPLGERHLGQPAQEVPVGRPPHLRMDPRVGRNVGEIAPEQRRDEREGVGSRGPGMACKSAANGMMPASIAVLENLRERLGGQVRPREPL